MVVQDAVVGTEDQVGCVNQGGARGAAPLYQSTDLARI